MSSLYREVREILKGSGFKPRKRLGQHFVVREGVIEAILRLVDLSPGDEILEVGPGLGSLTRRLVEVAENVWAVEVDSLLAEWLQRSPLGSCPAFHLVHGDILQTDLGRVLPEHKVKLVGNLPYGISTPILFRLFEQRHRFSMLVLMVQREVAERMAASPGTKSYGTLSIWCQIHGRIMGKVSVSPEAFFPRPKVTSTVLKIDLYPEPLVPAEDISLLRGVVRAAFGQRRKTLGNALGGLGNRSKGEIETILRQEGINPRRRGETLCVDEFIRLARALRPVLSADG